MFYAKLTQFYYQTVQETLQRANYNSTDFQIKISKKFISLFNKKYTQNKAVKSLIWLSMLLKLTNGIVADSKC